MSAANITRNTGCNSSETVGNMNIHGNNSDITAGNTNIHGNNSDISAGNTNIHGNRISPGNIQNVSNSRRAISTGTMRNLSNIKNVTFASNTRNNSGETSKRKKMLDVFKAVVTFFHRRHVQRDCLLFRLHHSVTTAILLIFCLIVGIHQFVRSPIICNSQMIPRDILDQYCWTHSTFSVTEAFRKKVGSEVPYPGVDIMRKDSPVKTQKYYQWVFLCLLFQAILFFLPGWLWNGWEGGKLRKLRMDLDVGFVTETDKNEKKKRLLEYLEQNRHNHNIWAYKYFFCEFLALVNVFGQMFLMNRFLDGEFLSFGARVLQFMESDEEDRVDPMILIFPRVTKCTFHRYSPSGNVERHDSICVLPLNILNEKIYVFLWFWCLGLLIATLGLMLYRSLLIVSPKLRHLVFSSRYRTIRRDVTDLLARQSEFGDWFLYYMLGENLDNIIFRDVMQEHAHRLRYCIRSSRTELTDCL